MLENLHLRRQSRSEDEAAPGHPRRGRTAMTVVAATAVAAVVGSANVAGAGPAQHWEIPVAGETLAQCPSGTYTVTSGSVVVTVHHDGAHAEPTEEPAEGETVQFVMAIRPAGVVLENESGDRFRLVGADHVNANYTASGQGWVATATHKMSIVRTNGGGVVERFNTVTRLRDGNLSTFELGTCAWQ